VFSFEFVDNHPVIAYDFSIVASETQNIISFPFSEDAPDG
jgi:hypothetical protein